LIPRFSILLLILLIGCAPQPISTSQLAPTSLPSTASEAHEVLINFFSLLSAGKYEEAATLYGGSYEQLQVNNPDVDANDHATLLQRACEINGLQCLQVRTATFKSLQGATYVFQVEFSNADGSLFVLGPCCGANETEMPPVSQFEYRVSMTAAGKFSVMDLPPYVP
jgi:hypothetical protein